MLEGCLSFPLLLVAEVEKTCDLSQRGLPWNLSVSHSHGLEKDVLLSVLCRTWAPEMGETCIRNHVEASEVPQAVRCLQAWLGSSPRTFTNKQLMDLALWED